MRIKNITIALVLLLVLQPVMAYEVRSTIGGLNLWDLFVEYVFGDFLLSVIGLAILLVLILIMGGISIITTGIFMGSFLIAMAIGYGEPLISVPIFAVGAIFFVTQLIKMWGEG